MRKTSPDVEHQIRSAITAGVSTTEIMTTHRVSSSVISRIRREMKSTTPTEERSGNGVTVSLGEQSGSAKIEATFPVGEQPRWLDVKNPTELLAKCNVDATTWEITSSRITSSEVTVKLRKQVGDVMHDVPATYTNMHVTVSLRKKRIAERAVEAVCARLLESPCKPLPVKHAKVRKDAVLLEWCPYDQHHGMLAWGPEVDEHYDLKISERFFLQACEKVLATASSYKVGQIIVPIGQDWFHCNDPSFATPVGKHRLDIEGRLLKVFETGYWALFRAIEQLRQVAPVHIMWVPGNHDPETSYYLVRVLAAHYMDPDGSFRRGVTVDYSPRSRKIYSWGNSCIGFVHPVGRGSWEKQRGIFSEVFKREWAAAKFHEIHTGHLHKVMEYEFMQADTLGSHTVIRMLPSLCATDKWHWEMGFVEKNRASASFIWDQRDGLVCQFTTRVEDHR